MDGNFLFLFGTEYSTQVNGLFHGTDKFFPAVYISGIIHFTDTDKNIGNIESIGIRGCNG